MSLKVDHSKHSWRKRTTYVNKGNLRELGQRRPRRFRRLAMQRPILRSWSWNSVLSIHQPRRVVPGFSLFFVCLFEKYIWPKPPPQKTRNTSQTPLKKRGIKKPGTSQFCTGVTNTVFKFQIEKRKIELCIAVDTFLSLHLMQVWTIYHYFSCHPTMCSMIFKMDHS